MTKIARSFLNAVGQVRQRMTLRQIACGVAAVLALNVAAYLLVPPPHRAEAQFADQGTWGGVSGGSANAQTITISNLYANKPGIILRFIPGAGLTNTGPTQINVSGIGLTNVLRPSSIGLVAFSGGEFQAGEATCISYNPVASAYQLECNVDLTPIGQVLEIRGASPPRGALIEDGSCISKTTYAPLFTVIGGLYSGSCSTGNFPLPDSRGTLFAAIDNQGVNGAAGRINSGSGCGGSTNVGTLCGLQTHTLAATEIPGINSSGSITVNLPAGNFLPFTNGTAGDIGWSASGSGQHSPNSTSVWTGTNSLTGSGQTMASTNTGGQPHSILNPILTGIRAIKY